MAQQTLSGLKPGSLLTATVLKPAKSSNCPVHPSRSLRKKGATLRIDSDQDRGKGAQQLCVPKTAADFL
eukprot:4343202-Amphidinium_carterae.1